MKFSSKLFFESYKKYIFSTAILIALVIIGFLIFFGVRYYKYHSKIIKESDPHLNAEQLNDRNQIIDSIRTNIADETSKGGDKSKLFSLYSQLGSELYVIGKYEQARAAYEQAQTLFLDNPITYEALYQIELLMGDYKAALADVRKVTELNPASPNNWVAYITIERDYFKMSIDDRIHLSEQAQQKTNKADVVMNQYGLLLEEKKDYQKAYDVFRELVLKDKTNPEYLNNLDRVNVEGQKEQQEKQGQSIKAN